MSGNLVFHVHAHGIPSLCGMTGTGASRGGGGGGMSETLCHEIAIWALEVCSASQFSRYNPEQKREEEDGTPLLVDANATT
jgi:hypothetical protein